ncbi:response regulator transcription factor [Paenibacillus phocaensis]|uniref:response regulator transcription factor n=1 Tax=Paenibacillus phocaensis TaxID=1776378 RepID=UPI000839BC42|nr:response regulator transcription factor [Paenibacillus phocaensis]
MQKQPIQMPIRVLVVEDFDILNEHFRTMVDGAEDMMLVGHAFSGKAACDLVEQLQPDVVLMDIEMDFKHDGILAAKKAVQTHPDVRIIFLTVHEDDETVFSAFDSGAVDYVLKTAEEHEILDSIRMAYNGSSPIRPEIAYKIRNEFRRIRHNQASLLDSIDILSQLTPTEMEIIDLLLKHKKISEIAAERQVEISTIKSQINLLLKKFNKSRTKEIVNLINEMGAVSFFRQVNKGDRNAR